MGVHERIYAGEKMELDAPEGEIDIRQNDEAAVTDRQVLES